MTGDGDEAVEIVVEMPEPGSLDASALESAAHECVAGVAADLDLPTEAATRLSVRAGPRLRLTVGGRRLRLVSTHHEFRLQPSSVAERICDSIRATPDCLVTPAVVARLWERIRTAGNAAAPVGLTTLVVDLVRTGARPSRLDGLVPDWSALVPDRAFEAALDEAGQPLVAFVDQATYEALRPDWGDRAASLATGLFEELGLIVGAPLLQADPDLPPHHFAVRVNDCRMEPRRGLQQDEALVNDTPERLALFEITAREATNPITGLPAAVVDAGEVALLKVPWLTTFDRAECLVLVLAGIARRHAGALYSSEVFDYQLDTIEPGLPSARRLVERIGGPDRLVRVLRRLLAEGVSIRNLEHVLRTLDLAPVLDADHIGVRPIASRPVLRSSGAQPLDHRQQEAALVAAARAGLARHIGHVWSRGTNTLAAYLVDRSVDARLLDARPLSDTEHELLLDMVSDELLHVPATAPTPTILASAMIRSRLRDVIAVERPTMAVLSYEELPADLNVAPVARLIPGPGFTGLTAAPGS